VGQKKLVRKAEPPSKPGLAWPRWTGFRGKTAWDWLQLLIVPLVLALVGLWLTTATQNQQQQSIEERRAEAQRQIEEQRAQDAALQDYLGKMKELLLDGHLRSSGSDSSVRAVANVQTLVVLEQLNGRRESSVLRLLNDAHLIEGNAPIIDLYSARLNGAVLGGMDLSGTSLSGADLPKANLEDANLSGAKLEDVNFSGANLKNANLSDANLSSADLSSAEGVTNEELDQQAHSLKGATIPNGQKYEEWLKSKGSGKD
jgi:uncharacterized protein YjbI with pentapeptide repeats